jgi:hypothetical protein
MDDNTMSAEQSVSIPYFVHEGEMTRLNLIHKEDKDRLDKLNKRWFISFLIVLAMLFASNIAWVIYEMCYQTVYISNDASSETGDSTALLTTGEGSVNYYGNAREASDTVPGETNEQQQPGEGVPDL